MRHTRQGKGTLQQKPAPPEAERLLGDCRPPHLRTQSHGLSISVRGSRAEPARGQTGLPDKLGFQNKLGIPDKPASPVATDTRDLETVRSFIPIERSFAPLAMSEPLALTLGQKFELERMNRAIDATADPQALRGLAKQLLQAWHSQKAATQWVMRQQLGSPARVPTELCLDTIGFDDPPLPGPDEMEAEEG